MAQADALWGIGRRRTRPCFFNVNGELWPEDDSDDEEFCLPEQMNYSSFTIQKNSSSPTKLLLKRDLTTATTGTKRKKKKLESPTCENTLPQGAWSHRIPTEILVKIFQYLVEYEGIMPLIHKLPWVCPRWKDVAQNPSLWHKVELSPSILPGYTPILLTQLCQSPAMSHCRELTLKDWGKMKIEPVIGAIAANCPQLLSLSLQHCNLSPGCLVGVAERCPRLCRLDLSGLLPSVTLALAESPLLELLAACRERLTALSLAQNRVPARLVTELLAAQRCPPALQVLDLSNLRCSSYAFCLPLEALQKGCPHLRVLLLANSNVQLSRPCPPQSPGFQELEELSIASAPESLASMGDGELERLVRDGRALRLLDVRGCTKITVSGLVRVPAWELSHLYISQCGATTNPGLEMVLAKWAASLRCVDLASTCKSEALDPALTALAQPQASPLRSLNLSSSAATYSSVKVILERCLHLTYLNLQSCRGLPRGMKRIYLYEELVTLRNEIKEGRYEQEL